MPPSLVSLHDRCFMCPCCAPCLPAWSCLPPSYPCMVPALAAPLLCLRSSSLPLLSYRCLQRPAFAAPAALVPNLVSLDDCCLLRLVMSALAALPPCLQALSPFMIAAMAAIAALSPTLVSLHGRHGRHGRCLAPLPCLRLLYPFIAVALSHHSHLLDALKKVMSTCI